MKLYKFLIKIFSVMCFASIIGSIILHYIFQESFFANILIGLFTGAFVSLCSSIYSYFHERNKTLEDYYYYLKIFLRTIGEYQDDWNLKEKVDFYIGVSEFDFSKNDILFGRISLFNKQDQYYIWEKIYLPVKKIQDKLKWCARHCKIYNSHINVSDGTIEGIIQQTEEQFMKYKACYVPELNNELLQSISNRFAETIANELMGRYFEIMCPKKKTRKNSKQEMSKEFNE